MPTLRYPVSQAGLTLPVIVGLNGADTSALVTAGKPVPAPIGVQGEIDTGSNVTAISPWVFQKLGLSSPGRSSTQTASGQVSVNLYEVSLAVLQISHQYHPSLTLPSVLVCELAITLPGVDVLIGLNVLLHCKLILDGPAGVFSLEF